MTQSAIENPFRQQLMIALENFTDSTWLGEHSPLATPYFLGEHLLHSQAKESTVTSRGQALQKLIRQTANRLLGEEDDGDYLYRILDLTFFRPQPLTQVLYQLGISKSTFYRPAHRPRAIQKLEQALIRHLKPALRLEEPPSLPQTVLGRQTAVADCLPHLQQHKTIAIVGNNGLGKTTLGAHLAHHWHPKPVFWFTLRPGLNDHLSSLLFSLGYFLQRQGASALWLQLVADHGQVNSEILLGLVRRDLASLPDKHPLLCIDEVDLLQPDDVEAHRQLLAFLSSLRSLTPILLMGRQMPLEVDWGHPLTGFPVDIIQQILSQANIHLPPTELTTLQTYTNGNPRLLQLFITLHRTDELPQDVLPRLATAPSLEFLLNRIWQRLNQAERNWLAALSVFRRAAPHDAGPDQITLVSLVNQNLIQMDDQGGVSLLPAFKAVIYHLLTPETRESLHLQAATIRATHGQYTAAAYHYIRGGQAGRALYLWYTHRRQEIDQGQGAAALELFAGLSRNQFNQPEREILVLLRSELRLLIGQYNAIKTDLYATLWQNPVLKGRASRIQGDIAYEQSRFEEAIHAYQDGLDTINDIGAELALFHQDIGKVYWQKRDLEQAWREALLARYEVEHLQGDIQEATGNYAQARRHYEEALSLAQKLNYIEGEGKTSNNLAWVMLKQGKIEAANQQWHRASDCYRQVGRLTWQAGIQINQAIAYTDTGHPQPAIPLLQEALAVFQSLGHTRGHTLAAYNLAEAYWSLEEIETAEQYAWQAIQQDEISLRPAIFNILARIRLAQTQFDEAEVFCQRSLELAQQNQNHLATAYSWRTLGQTYLAQQKNDQAQTALQKAITIFQELDLPDEAQETATII